MQFLDATTELRMAKHQIQQIAHGVQQGRLECETRGQVVRAQVGRERPIAKVRQFLGTLLSRAGERLRSEQGAAMTENAPGA